MSVGVHPPSSLRANPKFGFAGEAAVLSSTIASERCRWARNYMRDPRSCLSQPMLRSMVQRFGMIVAPGRPAGIGQGGRRCRGGRPDRGPRCGSRRPTMPRAPACGRRPCGTAGSRRPRCGRHRRWTRTVSKGPSASQPEWCVRPTIGFRRRCPDRRGARWREVQLDTDDAAIGGSHARTSTGAHTGRPPIDRSRPASKETDRRPARTPLFASLNSGDRLTSFG